MRAFLLFLLIAFPSWPAMGQAYVDLLLHYPSPEQVKKDILEKHTDAKPEEISGYQSGRLLMLADTIKYMHSSSGNVGSLPTNPRKLYDAYISEFQKIDRSINREKCGYFSNLFETCVGSNYNWSKVEYQRGYQAAEETASLYFPENLRLDFVKIADFHGLRDRNQKAAEEQGRKRFVNAFSWICIALGILNLALSLRRAYKLGKYRFKNTTGGGAIEFSSFNAALRHRFSIGWTALTLLSGLLLVGLGVAVRVFI